MAPVCRLGEVALHLHAPLAIAGVLERVPVPAAAAVVDLEDGVAATREQRIDSRPHAERAAGVQEWVSEVAWLLPHLSEYPARRFIAARDVVQIPVDIDRVQVGMRVRMVAELETRTRPLPEQVDLTLVERATAVELPLVHEPDGRHVMAHEGAHELRR